MWFRFPTLGQEIPIGLKSADGRERFFLDISRGACVSSQSQATESCEARHHIGALGLRGTAASQP